MTAPSPSPALHLYQIAYSDETAAAVEPGFELLDNRANPRPDWYEYLPIRHHLQTTALDDSAFYGFFSPKFRAKTGHGADTVRDFAEHHAAGADVLLFSPHPNQIAFFANVFEQGEHFHPGLTATCSQWLAAAGVRVPLDALVMSARHTVFCNYFVARPAFWRQWLALGENLFTTCEGPPGPLRQALTAAAGYTGGAQMKIFVMERLASLVLALQPHWRVAVADPYANARWPTRALQDDPTPAICSDALKHAHCSQPPGQPWPEYLAAFGSVRRRVLQGAGA